MTIKRIPTSGTAPRLEQQKVLQRLAEWDGRISPEAAAAGQKEQDEWERANACPIPVVFPVHD